MEQQLAPLPGAIRAVVRDINGDGKPDIVVQMAHPFKPYHGVYIFIADGTGSYTQEFFQHLDGAYGALLRDYDRDGSIDMLSFSYFPRFDRGDIDLVRYDAGLLNTKGSTWRVAGSKHGRWLVSDVADIDGDGDDDVLLGNVSMGSGIMTEEAVQRWMGNGVVALYLRNTTK